MYRKGGLLLICALSLLWSTISVAGPKIRMYEVNKKQQQRKIVIGSAVEEPGCHNLLWGKDVYRVAQFGFAWCTLYAREDCPPDAVIPAVWESGNYRRYKIKKGQVQDRLYPGEEWIVKATGRDVQSWHCEAKEASD